MIVYGVILFLQVYSCSADGTIMLWDFMDGILIKVLDVLGCLHKPWRKMMWTALTCFFLCVFVCTCVFSRHLLSVTRYCPCTSPRNIKGSFSLSSPWLMRLTPVSVFKNVKIFICGTYMQHLDSPKVDFKQLDMLICLRCMYPHWCF